MYANQLENIGINLKGRKKGTIKTKCPECSHQRKNKSDLCLSVNIDEGWYKCHHCERKGSVAAKDNFSPKESYTIPEINNTQLSDETLKYILSRGISKATVIRWQLTESSEYFPQTKSNEPTINFNYYRDNKLVNIKYRSAKSKSFKMSQGAELIFYGLDFIKEETSVIITEGEFDCLALYESGLTVSVSVPNGAGGKNTNLKYLDNCIKYFVDKKEIFLATDADQPGRVLAEELSRRLGRERCYLVSWPNGCKDANEVLLKHGKETVKKCIGEAERYPIEGIFTCNDLKNRFKDLVYNGFPQGAKTGFYDLDNLITWHPNQITIVTGIPQSGKSEFIDMIACSLADKEKWQWAIFSPENQPEEYHLTKLAEKIFEKPLFLSNGSDKISEEEIEVMIHGLNYYFFFTRAVEENLTIDGLLKKIRELIFRYGIKGAIIDPWNYLEHRVPGHQTETQYTSDALTKIANFAKTNGIHIILICHPTKIGKSESGKYKVPTLYDISGSANFFNKADNGLTIYRDFDTNIVTVYVQKIRFKHVGKLGFCQFTYNKINGRYSPLYPEM